MELRNTKKDENEKTVEASVVEDEKTLEASVVENDKDAGKDGEVFVEAEAKKDENEVVETSAGEKSKEDEESVETSMDAKPEEAASVLVSVEENEKENGNVKEPSVFASVEASCSGMEIPKGLLGKKKTVKKVKKPVKKKVLKGTAVQVAGEENVTVEQGVKTDEQSAEPYIGESEKETKDVVNEQNNGVEKANSLDVNTNEGGQQKNVDKTGLAEGKRRKRKRRGKNVVGSNKKQKNELVAASDVTKQLVAPEKREMAEQGKFKIGGLIFMCNAKTRPDCFRFSIMGVQEKRKDYVMSIQPGMKLFLYDYDLKLLYGIFQASSAGGMKLERNAFGGSFPAQVRFKVLSDCLPLPESQFKKAIKENYNTKNKFKTELTRQQVFKLTKLFRPAPVPAQLTHTLPILVPRDVDVKRSDRDRYAPGSSRTQRTRTRNASPPPRREEPTRDLYLTEREYRTYGLRRGETTQHHLIPPPESSYRDRVPLDSYRPSVDHERLLEHELRLRRAEMERHDRREVRSLHLPERDYHPYDHLSSRREILARNSPEPPASVVALDSYRRDPYYRYEYRSPERPSRTYLAPSGREDDDLYSRYVTADSLAEYYRSSRSRYPESELPPSSVTSRYGYSVSLPYSHR